MNYDSSKIAKNSLLLYLRMLVTTIIGLYTSRVVLDSLGIVDYGLYNVIGGIISLFGFVQHSLVNATSRYITYALGKKDFIYLNKVFNISLFLHIGLCIIIVALAETIGLWFMYNYMSIPTERTNDAFWVFQLSVAAIVLTVMSFPYNSLIIAHERMNVFAYIAMAESLAKLLIAFCLYAFADSRLILYAFLIFFVQAVIRIIYGWYCKRYFKESHLRWQSDWKLVREITTFASFSLLPGLGLAGCGQGLNVLLNMFFGPVANAARGISVQIQGLITKFTQSFQQATAPQITKLYAQDHLDQMHILITETAKLSFFIMFLISVPLMYCMDTILSLWLKEVPTDTADFCRMTLVINLLETIAYPFLVGASASGRIKLYYTVNALIMICIVPVSYVALKIGYPAISVYIVHTLFSVILLITRIRIGAHLINYKLQFFFHKCLLPIIKVILPTVIIYLLCWRYMSSVNTLLLTVLILLFTVMTIYIGGLTVNERNYVKSLIISVSKKYQK